MNKVFSVLACLFFSTANAQQLTVGDVMPDLKNLRFLKGGKYTDINLEFSKLDNKLIIFDFWSPGCGPCIAGLPKMDKMQTQFGDQVMILPIVMVKTKEEGEKIVADFWQKNPYTKKSTSLGTLVESKNKPILYHFFPNAGLPWEVWVKNGKIIGQTGPEYVNEKEINEILAGQEKDWAVAPGGASYKGNWYNDSIPLLLYLAKYKVSSSAHPYAYSTWGGYIAGKRSIIKDNFADIEKTQNKITIINTPILELYRYAITNRLSENNRPMMIFNNRYILEINDLSTFKKPDNIYEKEWLKNNSYSYELLLPLSYTPEQVLQYMEQDLNKFFNLYGRVEKRKVKCWIITRNSIPVGFDAGLEKKMMEEKDKLIEKMGVDTYLTERDATDYKRGWREQIITNSELLTIVLNGNSETGNSENAPVLNETNFTGNLSFLLRVGNKISFKEYQEQLRKNGFDLKRAEREIDMFVISDK